jgi:hypothetical protein
MGDGFSQRNLSGGAAPWNRIFQRGTRSTVSGTPLTYHRMGPYPSGWTRYHSEWWLEVASEVLIFGFRKVVQNHDLQMEKNRDLAYNVDVKNFFDGLDRATR